MKTTIRTTIIRTVILASLLFGSVILTKRLVQNVKELYTSEGKGKGSACFFDMIQ